MTLYKKIFFTCLAAMIFTSCNTKTETSTIEKKEATVENEITKLKIENILRDTLELVDGVEVIMSYVEVPKATTLPYHYHPGEEFAYLMEGSGELILKDQSKKIIKAGEAGKVPLKQIHSFSTKDEAAKMVVFRVHEKGQPDRILVEDH